MPDIAWKNGKKNSGLQYMHASTLHAFNYYQSFDFIVYTVSVPGFWKWSQLTECKSASVSRENGPDLKKK